MKVLSLDFMLMFMKTTRDICPGNWDVLVQQILCKAVFVLGSRARNMAHPFAGLQLGKKGSSVCSLLARKSASTDSSCCPTKRAREKIGCLLGQVS